MRLALAMGEVNVDRMLSRITCRQFLEWCAFYAIDPFGSQRQDYNFAALMLLIASALGEKKKTIDDFLLFKDDDKAKNDPAKQQYAFKLLAGFMGGNINGEKS